MSFKKEDLAIAIISLLVVLYTLWYVLTHSPQFVSYSDLFAVWGGTLTILGLFLNKIYTSVDMLDGKINTSVDRLEDKINNLIKEFSYIRGFIDGKKR
jgi:hypothetical protein